MIGLAIAVVVALVITKGATPFTDKGHPNKSTAAAADNGGDEKFIYYLQAHTRRGYAAGSPADASRRIASRWIGQAPA